MSLLVSPAEKNKGLELSEKNRQVIKNTKAMEMLLFLSKRISNMGGMIKLKKYPNCEIRTVNRTSIRMLNV